MIRLGVLGSTKGSSLEPVLAAIQAGQLDATVAVVISHRPEAGILARAGQYHVPAVYATTERDILATLQTHEVEAVLLIGWMRLLSPSFVTVWQNRIFNVHPSLLPAFAGGMNESVHRDVLAAGCSESGCSVHRVTEVVDGGEVVIQKRCPVLPEDTVESLKHRVQMLEGEALIELTRELERTLCTNNRS